MKKLLGIITGLSTVVTLYLFWMMFFFNARFAPENSHSTIQPIKNFIRDGGIIHLTVLGVISLILMILFLIYAYKDSHRQEVYDDRVSVPELTRKDNLFSAKRIVQYLLLIILVIRVGTCIYNAFTIHPDMEYRLIFQTDFMLTSLEFIFVYFAVFTGSLFVELINDSNNNYV